jgi:hypothetical protein
MLNQKKREQPIFQTDIWMKSKEYGVNGKAKKNGIAFQVATSMCSLSSIYKCIVQEENMKTKANMDDFILVKRSCECLEQILINATNFLILAL